MEWPSTTDLGKMMPLSKTLIHFEIDSVTNMPIGFGEQKDVTVDPVSGITTEFECRRHDVNFDVGIWSSARSGGTTARLNAYQLLTEMFVGPSAYFALKEIGIELMGFTGFACIREEIDDIEVFRAMDMTLMLRVYSQKALDDGQAIQTIIQDGVITIDDELLIDATPLPRPLTGNIAATSHL